jgi:hypothetical protein
MKMKAANYHVYLICYPDDYEEVRLFPEETVVKMGGVDGLEADIAGRSSWYSPIGEIKTIPDMGGGVKVRVSAVKKLKTAWEENGALKKPGTGTPDQLRKYQD